MKSVLEEYGMILVVVAIVLIFVLFATPLGGYITGGIKSALDAFFAAAVPSATPPTMPTA